MRGRWIRSAVVLGTLGVLAVMLAGPTLASGGGGCGRAVTDERGTEVRVKNFCFGPTILRVARGETVTWVNRDSFEHVILGANGTWGSYGTLGAAGHHGSMVSYRFTRTGVYPYVCTYHPGMIGAVVVGDGSGRGIADAVTTADGPVVPDSGVGSQPVVSVPPPEPSAWPAIIGWGAGAVLVIGAIVVARRRGASTA